MARYMGMRSLYLRRIFDAKSRKQKSKLIIQQEGSLIFRHCCLNDRALFVTWSSVRVTLTEKYEINNKGKC